MLKELNYYRLTPAVAEVGKETKFTVSPLDVRYNFRENMSYSVKIYPMTRNVRKMVALPEYRHDAHAEGNNLVFSYTFDKEEEYVLKIYENEPYNKVVQLSIYALDSDMFALRPLKGDLHVHSCRLIGPHTGSQETPGYTAADYRQAGYDFLAITDHEFYGGSVEMQENFKGVALGMELMNGEEIHAPENFMHFNAIGGKQSVNTYWQENKDRYTEEVQHIVDTEEIPYEDKFLYASILWVARKTKEFGGLAVLNHPHWVSNVYSMPDEINKYLLKDGIFDAYEIVGAATRHANNMKEAFYYQMMSEGIKVPPVIGVSDSHGTINGVFKNKYTICFAKQNKSDDILNAIKDYKCVAVEHYDEKEYNVVGEYRYVAYARWLIENYFPYMPIITNEEGKLMHEYILGDKKAKVKLEERAENTKIFYKKFYGIK